MMKYCRFILLLIVIVSASCNDSSKKKVLPVLPVTVAEQYDLGDTLHVHVVISHPKGYDRAYIGGLITNLSESITYKDPVIQFTRDWNEGGKFVTEVVADSCVLHMEVAPGATMTFISDCFIPANTIDTANAGKKEYYGKVKTAERITGLAKKL